MAYTYLIRAQASTKKDIELLEHTKGIFETRVHCVKANRF